MEEKLLFVDDDSNVLAALQRQMRGQFVVKTAMSGQEGLDVLQKQGPFAVVVADMRMPGMDGVKFLSQVAEVSPKTVRVMLTGNADLQTAIDAVNNGHIFRFLTKPCPTEILMQALNAAIEQYRLVMAEKEVLEKTLTGSIKMLTDVLGLVVPSAFSRANRVKRVVRHIVSELNLPDAWQVELAALLSQIGCITLTPELLAKKNNHEPMTDAENLMYARHPQIGRKLLEQIPRLELIARMVEGQHRTLKEQYLLDLKNPNADTREEQLVSLGSHILKTVLDFDDLVMGGSTPKQAFLNLVNKRLDYRPEVLKALSTLSESAYNVNRTAVAFNDLKVGMIIIDDVRDENGNLIVAGHQEVTYPLLMRLMARFDHIDTTRITVRVVVQS
jgi:FixJ family two-component response regulator